MKFSNILLLSIILGGGYTYFFERNEPPPMLKKLIDQFAKQTFLEKNDWSKDKVVDGVQWYTAREKHPSSIWALSEKKAKVTVLTSEKHSEIEPVQAMAQCENLAVAVFDSDSKQIKEAVSAIFTTAADTYKKEGKKVQATGDIGSLPFRVTVQNIDSVLTFSCDIDLSHYTSSI
jgi:hypothetical protein